MIYFKLLMTAFFWGGTFVAGRVLADSAGPYSAAFIRFAVASFFLCVITCKIEGRLPRIGRKQFLNLFLLGMTGVFAYNVFFFKGLKLISAGRAAVIIANNPIIISVLSAIVFKEKLGFLKISGILISVSGAVIALSKGNPAQLFAAGPGVGDLIIFGCVLSWAAYSLIGKTVMESFSPMASVACSSAIGAVCLFIPACIEGMLSDIFTYSLADWISLVYLGIFGTVVGFVWYYEGIKTIGPARASIFINFVPLSAIVLAFVILGEPVSLSLLMGVILVITGVFLTNVNTMGKSKVNQS